MSKRIVIKNPKATIPKLTKPKSKAPSKKPKPADEDLAEVESKGVSGANRAKFEEFQRQQEAEQRAKLAAASVAEQPATEDEDDDGAVGNTDFVRMINTVGLVRPVPAESVPDRIFDGYFFIIDEPSVPRRRGVPDRCDCDGEPGFTITPQFVQRPDSIIKAYEMWLRRMRKDQDRYALRKDLKFGWMDWCQKKIRAMVDGAPDTVYADRG